MIPAFLRLPVCALDISDRSYKYLLLKSRGNAFVVSDFGEGNLPAGIVENGEIYQRDTLITILRDLFVQKKIQFVSISLPEEKGFLKSIKMPTSVRANEVGSSLALQIEEHVPLPAAEVAFDYTLGGADDDHFDIVLRAFPRSILDSYLDIAAKAGALPVFVEPELDAMVRAVVPYSYAGTGMLIDWGATRASFAVFYRNVVRFAATAPVGGALVTAAIAKQMNVSAEEADRLKKTKGRLVVTQESMNNDKATQAIMPLINAILEETKRYLLYWQSHSENNSLPERIYLAGGDVNIRGLPEYFSAELGVSTIFANPWENISFPPFYLPELSWKDSLRFISTIGLCLQSAEECQFL
ncbi:hypothetical protein A3J56_00610 [Candidatus Giovannonibacteria bacterium RIFCSPHIGHO2_02_FULL_46_20]|uniref:SHS2 domain-containing protein n=1 Tax=Candidatus Giovannonibacteria bacterium RIFCSPHIGHO2_02_FULL_46_20 TaxID=1798338 RepID=A0A1F5WDF2_9BACT|nr:MAG: hypothetical protein A3J56_00610 [Candidatus Giovannonibacteria bacterium RIFCSPHIGHO2_02_FULL_46_20]